ncbi:MAG: family transcriptional regulator [Chloroflexi bacterium]|nr:family transcriptional regulator [Chloroflexota bacterium]
MNDAQHRTTLARFLRTRRERIRPEHAGLPAGGRRRTPGLRREELAQLAGVGATWYTWLEQGRPIRVSAAVLESIARTLHLDPDERAYLFVLARDETTTPLPAFAPAIAPNLQQVLDALDHYPCYVLDARWNVVAWNAAACVAFADFPALSGRERNILWRMFTYPAQRTFFVQWEQEAQIALAIFRAGTVRYVGEAWYTELVADLMHSSPEFAAWWPRADLRGVYAGQKEIDHPKAGRMVFQPVTLLVAETQDQRVVAFAPLAETDTECKLRHLLSVKRAQDERDIPAGIATRRHDDDSG